MRRCSDFTLSYMQGERGKPPFTIFGNAIPMPSNGSVIEREDDAENFSAQLAFSHDFTGPLSVKGWGYFNALDVLESNYDNFNYNTLALNRAYRYDASPRFPVSICRAATMRSATAQRPWDSCWKTMIIGSRGLRSVATTYVRTDVNGNWDFQLYSVNLEYEVSPLPKLGVVLGVGHHWQDRSEKTTDDTSYLVGLTYQLFEPTRLKFSHSRKVRFPTLRDLYDPQRGNPDLKPEVTWHFEGGVEQQLPGRTLFSVTGFYAEAEDFIERPEGFDIVINNDKYEFTGVEVAVENTYFDGLWMRASYDYLDTEDASPGSTRPILQNRPRHSATLEASYRLPWWGLSTYGSARWVANTYYNARTGNLPQRRYPEYLLVDWRINKAAAGGALDLYFGINNLLDANYEQSYGLPQAGRMIYGGVNWKF
jgi:vitamin B12 transporter